MPGGLDHAEGTVACFMIALGGVLSKYTGMAGLRLVRDGQMETKLEDMDMAGLPSAWAMARRRPKEYSRKVDAATRCSGVCPHS